VGPRRLTLLRHGEAEPIDARVEDFERALTRRGILEAEKIAARILQHRLVPDLILASPAERAWGTAEILARACELEITQLQCERELYLATPETTWRLLAGRDDAIRHILICGHNPGLSQLASRLGPSPERRTLPTGGLATAEWHHHAGWSSLQPQTAASCELDDPDNANDWD
jgi:phosphohistidine phosphatase